MTDAEPPATTRVRSLPPGVADEQFATRLREERERRNWSQADVARLMTERGWGWPQQTVQKIEAGHRKVSVGEAKALAEVFDTTMERLTLPGREASFASMLSDYTTHADRSWGQIKARTMDLLQARLQLSLTVDQAEAAGYLGSAEIRKLADVAREAMRLEPEEAVADGRQEFARLREVAESMAGRTEEGSEPRVAHRR